MAIKHLILAIFPFLSHHHVDLTWQWQANSTPAINFEVQRARYLVGPFKTIATLPLSATSYTDSKVAAGTFFYRVTVFSAAGSATSNVSKAVVP